MTVLVLVVTAVVVTVDVEVDADVEVPGVVVVGCDVVVGADVLLVGGSVWVIVCGPFGPVTTVVVTVLVWVGVAESPDASFTIA